MAPKTADKHSLDNKTNVRPIAGGTLEQNALEFGAFFLALYVSNQLLQTCWVLSCQLDRVSVCPDTLQRRRHLRCSAAVMMSMPSYDLHVEHSWSDCTMRTSMLAPFTPHSVSKTEEDGICSKCCLHCGRGAHNLGHLLVVAVRTSKSRVFFDLGRRLKASGFADSLCRLGSPQRS